MGIAKKTAEQGGKQLPLGTDKLTHSLTLPGLDMLWAETVGDPNISIAMLDGPVDQTHPSFDGVQLSQVETFVSGPTNEGMATQHGTHIASILFGHHGGPVKGIAPGCRGISVPVFSEDEDGSVLPCSQLDLARAIGQALDNGANVINISGGELIPSGEPHPLLAQAIRRCADNNVLIVAAVGNDGCQCLHVPAAAPTVLAVGATDAAGEPLASSNWGPLYEIQGILAPGENIPGVVPGGGVSARTGTSFATPIVSGVVGLLLSLQLKRGKQADPHGVRAALLQSAYACDPQAIDDCRRYMVGSLNITGAQKIINKEGANLEQATDRRLTPAARVGDNMALERAVIGSDAASSLESQSPLSASGVHAAGCGCGCDGALATAGDSDAATLVYALGTLGTDFGTEARLDSFAQSMGGGNPSDPGQLLAYLEEHPYAAESCIWTLDLDSTPIYGIKPVGSYAQVTYARLREFLNGNTSDPVQRVSVPGTIVGKTRLLSGQEVPLIVPAVRGMTRWSTDVLVENVLGRRPRRKADRADYDRRQAGLQNFLDRVYYELRNLGTSPGERAMNFAATNAFQADQVFAAAARDEMELDAIAVEQSPVCRPESECWDVKLTFFDPSSRLERAQKVYRLTVDVSDLVPVRVGEVRSWSEY